MPGRPAGEARRPRPTLHRQLLGVLLAMSLPLLVVVLVGALLLRTSAADHEASAERVRRGAEISDLQAQVAALSASLTEGRLLEGDRAAERAVLDRTRTVEQGFVSLRADVPSVDRSDVERAYVEWQRLVLTLATLPAKYDAMLVDPRVLSGALADVGPRMMRIAEVLSQASASNAEALQGEMDASNDRRGNQLAALLALALVGLGAAVLSSGWLHRRISRPLLELQKAADRFGSDDDVAERLDEDRTPELGALARAFNGMAERLVANRRLMLAREQRFRALVQHSSDLVAVLDTCSTIGWATPSSQALLGLSADQAVGTRLLDLVHPDDRALVASVLDAATPGGGVADTVTCRLARPGADTWCRAELVVNDLRHEPAVEGLVVTARDVTEQTRLHEQLRHSAFHDELTGLANRVLFADRLQHALTGRVTAHPAVLYCDLDGFKNVNDSLGHAAGDALLGVVADRISAHLRARDTAARFGGDEFAVLLEDVTGEEAVETAHRLLTEVGRPVLLDGVEVVPQLSVGVAPAGPDVDAEGLLRQADAAMYQAKRHPSDAVVLYDDALGEHLLDRLALTADLQRALRTGEFLLHYQPTVDLATGDLSGVEALVRWEHPTRGLVPPLQFIALAEETGVIVPLGRWVLRTACAQVHAWQASHPGHRLRLSVNLSGRQLETDEIVGDVAAVLTETGLDASCLTLELTESVLLDRSEEVVGRLHALKALGVALAIDDFGTGYSSLSYLQRLPIDVLKIDKSFVDALAESGTGDALAATIVQLAHTLGLTSVAEGIEHEDQASALRLLGCDTGQGFLYARPLPASALGDLLDATPVPMDLVPPPRG